MPHTSETPLAVKLHSSRRGFVVTNSKTKQLLGAISFDSLHKIHHGMKEVAAGRMPSFESTSDYGVTTVKMEDGLHRVSSKPYDSKASPVDALVSMETVEIMIALANDFLRGQLDPNKTFAIHPEAVSKSEVAVA